MTDHRITGRRAVICASSRGLGRACAEALAAAGCEIAINGVDAPRLEAAAEAIRAATGATVHAVAADVGTPEGQDALLAALPEPDILINNNLGPPLRDWRGIDRAAIFEGVALNMAGPIEMTQKVVPAMERRGWGRIVNITSQSVKAPIFGLDLSSGARAGLTAFMAGVSRDLARRGVTINHLAPGMFDTDRLAAANEAAARLKGVTREEIEARRLAGVPAGRFGRPEEFGAACAWLCSDQAGFVVGQTILIDGGASNAVF